MARGRGLLRRQGKRHPTTTTDCRAGSDVALTQTELVGIADPIVLDLEVELVGLGGELNLQP